MLFQQQARPTSCFRVWVIPLGDQQVDSAHPRTTCPLRELAVQASQESGRRSLGFGIAWHCPTISSERHSQETPPSCSRPQKPSS